MALPAITAIAALASTANAVQQGAEQKRTQRRQLRRQEEAQAQAQNEALAEQRRGEERERAVNQQTPDMQAVLDLIQRPPANTLGASTPNLSLGRKTLLGE